MKRHDEIIFEDSLGDEWAHDAEIAEVPLGDEPLRHLAWILVFAGALVMGRIIFIGSVQGAFYNTRADRNLNRYEQIVAPRGLITDRFGSILADNTAVFSALLNIKEFLRHPDLQAKTLSAFESALAIPHDELVATISASDLEASSEPIVLAADISADAKSTLESLDLPTVLVNATYRRTYPSGPIFSSIIGYVGLATKDDLEGDPELTGRSTIGKMGLEQFYDSSLRGTAGIHVTRRDAKGQIIDEQEKSVPEIGETLALAIDGELQTYAYERLRTGLANLGRTRGAVLIIDPRNGDVLTLASFPAYDNNVFVNGARRAERVAILTDEAQPLFNRIVSGLYTPGSTIKPLVGIAALKEGLVDPGRTVFSPGYLEFPNPYNASQPIRYLDWRYQGTVNLASAIAQSSNVYFYEVGGGSPPGAAQGQDGFTGLGIARLNAWWQRFKLGEPTGIDLPGEAKGFLPSAEWKQKERGRAWLLGDTYNVSIGQGDLLLTPIQLLDYVAAVANNGIMYEPHLARASSTILANLSTFAPEIREVQKGMRMAVTSPLGTAHKLDDLPFAVGAKTGSSQVENNAKENAFFVGYAPYENPQIAILILVENSKEGSLNAVPIAKDMLDWYYWHRIIE